MDEKRSHAATEGIDTQLLKTLRRDLSWLLTECPFTANAKICSRNHEHVLCVGELIPQKERTFFRGTASKSPRAYSGTIGSMIFYVAPKESPDAFCINTVGVEEDYLGEGYASSMVDWGERAANALYLPTVHIEHITHPRIRDIAKRRGYEIPPQYKTTWVKKISNE